MLKTLMRKHHNTVRVGADNLGSHSLNALDQHKQRELPSYGGLYQQVGRVQRAVLAPQFSEAAVHNNLQRVGSHLIASALGLDAAINNTLIHFCEAVAHVVGRDVLLQNN